MDMPRYLADKVKDLTGEPVEVDPSRADIKDGHFVVTIDSFWEEPDGVTQSNVEGNYTYEENGIPVEIWDQALPVRVVYKSTGIGESWRAAVIEQTRKNAIHFAEPFFVPALGGKFTGQSAVLANDGQKADLGNFDTTNKDDRGLGFVVKLKRDKASDKVFEPVDRDGKRNGYIAEQHFTGHMIFTGGQRVPDDQRRY